MAASELIGSKCPKCKKLWRSRSDFKRIHVFAAPFITERKSMTPAVYWSVHCRICGQIVEVVYAAEEE